MTVIVGSALAMCAGPLVDATYESEDRTGRVGLNLQTMKDEVLFLLEHRFGPESSPQKTDVQVFRALNEAQCRFVETIGTPDAISDSTVDLVSGTYEYALPELLLGGSIKGVKIKGVSGTWSGMTRRSVSYLMRKYCLGAGTPPSGASGEPVEWAVDLQQRGILLFPVPERNASGAISLRYDSIPAPLHRVWNPGSSVTASVEYGSDSVTLSGAIPSGKATTLDEFGVTVTEQSDGESIPTQSPIVWHRILTIESGTDLTLSEVWTGATDSAAEFIMAQPSELDIWNQGKMGNSLALYAAGLLYRGTDRSAREMSAEMRGEAIGFVRSVTRDLVGEVQQPDQVFASGLGSAIGWGVL